MNNPYPQNKGFDLRVHRAEKAIKKLAFDPFANIYTHSSDNYHLKLSNNFFIL